MPPRPRRDSGSNAAVTVSVLYIFSNFSLNAIGTLLVRFASALLRKTFCLCKKNLLLLLQGLTKQYPATPVVDNELLQMSMRLFRRTMAGQAAGPERSDAGSVPAAEVAPAGGSKLGTAQPEVCVS